MGRIPGWFFSSPDDERNVQAPVWISNSLSRQHAHKTRTEVQSILIGRKTAVQDKARLTARDWVGASPHRLLLDPKGIVPENFPIFDDSAPTTVFMENSEENSLKTKKSKASVELYTTNIPKDLPGRIAQYLNSIHCNSLLVEGGAKTLQSYLDSGLWDEIHLYRGADPMVTGIPAPKVPGILFREKAFLKDNLFFFKNPDNPFIT